ncbi:uncharacterized protein METZ01_LOCUS479435, partial [marine metagenome]
MAVLFPPSNIDSLYHDQVFLMPSSNPTIDL